MDELLSGDLTADELNLIESLPKPPAIGRIVTTNVWIVEWLGENDRKTGSELYSWLQSKRMDWPNLVVCRQKSDVISAIKHAANFARTNKAKPILHIEAHGNEDGIEGPNGIGGSAFIPWEELTPHLRDLNVAVRCNLILVCAACQGIASMISAATGDRIPCVAVVGPDSAVDPSRLLLGMKELYRNWMNGELDLDAASREMAPVSMEIESMVLLSYESFTEYAVRSTRPENQAEAIHRLASFMETMGRPYDDSVDHLKNQAPFLPRRLLKAWRSLFMIDIYPENRDNFDFDVKDAIWKILRFRSLA